MIDLIAAIPVDACLICHGLQGFFAGLEGKSRYLGLVLAAVSMVGGWPLGQYHEWCWAGLVDVKNFMQNVFGLVVGCVSKSFQRVWKKMATVK